MDRYDEEDWRLTMTKRPSVELGGIYAIPGGGHYAFAKVIYMSEYFKDVLLVRMYERAFPSIDVPSSLEDVHSRGIYAGIDSVKKGAWVLAGSAPVTDADRALTRRVVGGDVWVEDVHIGPASDEELRALPNMDVYGYRLIEKAVARLE
ncbi:MAG: hypothetical protein KF892_10045 [Rhizobacter sp.]|nr:hypothetical protein [Rhizobacter sp.]